MKTPLYLFGALLYQCHAFASAAISVTGPTTGWIAITYANPNQADPANDHQTGGVEGDIVGNATHASLYTDFDGGGTPSLTDGEIGFRVRLAGDANPTGLKTVVWIGIDANADGKIDLFAGALEDTKVGFYVAGASANTSPSTTSISTSSPYYEANTSSSNFSFAAVNSTIDPTATSFNLDNGSGGGANHTDHFVSFILPFSSLVTAVNSLGLSGVGTFNENSPLRFIAATSNQANSLNQDLNGVNGSVNSTTTWTALGGFTQTSSPNGLIPEPSGLMLSACGLGFALFRRTKRSAR